MDAPCGVAVPIPTLLENIEPIKFIVGVLRTPVTKTLVAESALLAKTFPWT